MVDILQPGQPYTPWELYANSRSSVALEHALALASGPLNYATLTSIQDASERQKSPLKDQSVVNRFRLDSDVPVRSRLRRPDHDFAKPACLAQQAPPHFPWSQPENSPPKKPAELFKPASLRIQHTAETALESQSVRTSTSGSHQSRSPISLKCGRRSQFQAGTQTPNAFTCQVAENTCKPFRVPSLPSRTTAVVPANQQTTPALYSLAEQPASYAPCPSRPSLSPASTVSSQSTQLDYDSDANQKTCLDPAAIFRNKRRSSLPPGQLPPSLPNQKDGSDCFVKYLMCKSTSFHIVCHPLTEGVDFATALLASIWPNSAYGRGISLFDFVSESLRRSKTSYSTLQVALFYIIMLKPKVPEDRFTKEQNEGLDQLPLQCGRRMFLSALMLASKYLQDKNYSTTAWSKITGLTCAEINEHERMVLAALDYSLHIPKDIFGNWNDLVIGLCQRTLHRPPATRVTFGMLKEVPASWQIFVQDLDAKIFHDSTQAKILTEKILKDTLTIPIYEAPFTRPQIHPPGQPAATPNAGIHYPLTPPESAAGSPPRFTGQTAHQINAQGSLSGRSIPFMPAPISRRPSKMDLGHMLEQIRPSNDSKAFNATPDDKSGWSKSQEGAADILWKQQSTRSIWPGPVIDAREGVPYGSMSAGRRRRTPSPLSRELVRSSTIDEQALDKTPVPVRYNSDSRCPTSTSPESCEELSSEHSFDCAESIPSLNDTDSTQSSSQPRTPTTCVQSYLDPYQGHTSSQEAEKEKVAVEALLKLAVARNCTPASTATGFVGALCYPMLSDDDEEEERDALRDIDTNAADNKTMHKLVQEELAADRTPKVGQILPDSRESYCTPCVVHISRKHSSKKGKKRPGSQQVETLKKRTKTDAPRSRHGKRKSVSYCSPPSSPFG